MVTNYVPGHADAAAAAVFLLLLDLALVRQQSAATATQMAAARTAIVMPKRTALRRTSRGMCVPLDNVPSCIIGKMLPRFVLFAASVINS